MAIFKELDETDKVAGRVTSIHDGLFSGDNPSEMIEFFYDEEKHKTPLREATSDADIYDNWITRQTDGGLGPFWNGATAANLAWLSIWPLDVVKSQLQSGNYGEKPKLTVLLRDAAKSGLLYRGLLPGPERRLLVGKCIICVV